MKGGIFGFGRKKKVAVVCDSLMVVAKLRMIRWLVEAAGAFRERRVLCWTWFNMNLQSRWKALRSTGDPERVRVLREGLLP